jgi:hypothetical protein
MIVSSYWQKRDMAVSVPVAALVPFAFAHSPLFRSSHQGR